MRGSAVILLAATAAGCSAQMQRFGIDDFYTLSTTPQQAVSQPAQVAPIQAASAGTVSRGSLAAPQVAQSSLPPPAAPQQVAMVQPAAPRIDNTTTAAITPPSNPQGGTLGTLNGQAAKAAVKSTATAAAGTYKVQDGDTLSKISRNTGVSLTALKEANNLQDGSIRIGQTLTLPSGAALPAATKVAALKPDTAKSLAPAPLAAPKAAAPVAAAATEAAKKTEPTVAAYTPPKKDKLIEQAEEDQATAPNATGISRMRWPVRGRVISSYGKGGGKSNDGIDIAVPEGTPVKAAENGVVIYAGDGLKEFGNTVLVRHEDGLVTVYGHASAIKVTRGQKVKRGDEVALSGMSGTTTAPKLHFEVRKNSTPVDPSGYLE